MKRKLIVVFAAVWGVGVLVSLGRAGFGLSARLPSLFSAAGERALVTSGDAEYHRFLSEVRRGIPAEEPMLLLVHDPGRQHLFFTYRASYELYPARHFYIPLSTPPPPGDRFRIRADEETLELVAGKSVRFAAVFVKGHPGIGDSRGGAYRIAAVPGGGLEFTAVSPDQPERPGFSATRAWAWLPGVAAAIALGCLFNALAGMSPSSAAVKIALGWFTGAGINAWWLLVTAILGIRWSLPLAGVPLLVVLGVAGWFRFRGVPSARGSFDVDEPASPWPYRWVGPAGWILVAVAVAIAALAALPPLSAWSNWDAWAIWSFKARAFWGPKTIPYEFLHAEQYKFMHPDYPPGIPLVQTFLALWAGGVSDTLLRLASPVFYFVLAVLFAELLKELRVGPERWILSGALILTPQLREQSFNGYADLPVAAAIVGAALIFVKARAGRAPLWTVGLMCGVGALMKNEALILALGCAGWVGVWWWRRRVGWRQVLACALVMGAFAVPWRGVVHQQKFKPTFEISIVKLKRNLPFTLPLILRASRLEAFGPGLSADRLRGTAPFSLRAMVSHLLGKWLLLWYAVAAGVVVGALRLARPPAYELASLLIMQLAAAWAVYTAAQFNIVWIILTSLDRLLLQVAPLALAVAAACFFPIDPPMGDEKGGARDPGAGS